VREEVCAKDWGRAKVKESSRAKRRIRFFILSN